MSDRSSVDGRYWFPLGTRNHYGEPEVGQLVAHDHQAWRVVEIRTHRTDTERPLRIRLRPARLADHPDPVTAASGDQHFSAGRHVSWHVFPDPQHYPVCACCGEPMPCREETGRRMAERAITTMTRHENPSVCPACSGPFTTRQKTITFDDNLEVPGGPPVTFHMRGKCRGDALTYEKRWAAAQPGRRRQLSCDGDLTNHNDGTYECTAHDLCPGPAVPHLASLSVCGCAPCHARPWTWGRGCQPHPDARRRGTPTDQPDLWSV